MVEAAENLREDRRDCMAHQEGEVEGVRSRSSMTAEAAMEFEHWDDTVVALRKDYRC